MDIREQAAAPVVSVILPAYNAEKFIKEAISSVVQQTLRDWELLVIDDCSSDATYDLAREITNPRIRVLKNEENIGVAATRNRGIELSRGQYVAFLDSDDAWQPEKLERQLERMAQADAQLCYSSYAIVGADGAKVKADYMVPESIDFEGLLKENVICCSSMLFRADVIRKIQLNTEFYHEDYILGLEILKNGYRAAGCREVLVNWRYLENSRSFDKRKSAQNRWRVYRDYFRLPLGKSIYLFCCYAAAGLRKYGSRSGEKT